MNKRYIDFVPSRSRGTAKRGQAAPRVAHVEMPNKTSSQRAVHRNAVKPVARSVVSRTMPAIATRPQRSLNKISTTKTVNRTATKTITKPVQKITSRASGSTSKTTVGPMLGVVEDLGARGAAVSTSTQKATQTKVASVAEAKAKKVKASGLRSVETRPEAKATKPTTKSTYNTPKSPFINQSKIEKRPLSKNVYQKKLVVPKEEPKGPVTIITKPEKDSHVGIIVTIIMTIILGATAGTVAFLLLPK